MKKVVLDTNVLLVSISSKSRLHWIFRSLLEGKYILCVTTDILAEYAEIIFVDCAIASNAAFLVSHDKDFNILKRIEFPKVVVISTEQFSHALMLP